MPRYFFHFDGHTATTDHEGVELPDLEAAKRRAVQVIGRRLLERPELFWESDSYQVSVADEGRLVLFQIQTMATLSASVPEARAAKARRPAQA